NYKVKDAGPSGLARVDLWYTRDGRTWKQYPSSIQHFRPPYLAEVDDEGLYGFTLVACNSRGISKAPPKSGDPPQIWVEVDVTKPVVNLIGVAPSLEGKARNVLIRWRASDKNLGNRPITLSYAEQSSGPWIVLASKIENKGLYVWQMPSAVPRQVYVRVEAT